MRLPLVLLLLVVTLPCDAQKQGQDFADSLIERLRYRQPDTNRIKLLNRIAYAYTNIDPASGLRYAAEEIRLALENGNLHLISNSYTDIGNCYLAEEDLNQSLSCFYKALSICEELNDTIATSRLYGNIGVVFERSQQYEKALDNFFKSRQQATAVGDSLGIINAASNIGLVYDEQDNRKEAARYSLYALELARRTNNKGQIATLTGQLSTIYSGEGDHARSLSYGFEAVRMAKALGDAQNEASQTGNIGCEYLSIAEDGGYLHPDSLIPAGRAANLALAARYLEHGISACLAASLTGALPGFSQTLSRAYALQGRFKDALSFYQQYNLFQDSLHNLESTQRIADLETAREVSLRDKDIRIAQLSIAKKRSERYFFAAGIALLLALTGLLFRSYRKQRRSNRLLAREKQRSEDLLLNILPEEVAEELKQKGSAEAQLYDEVSVLFTDFVNFTQRAEKLLPQALVSELHECFTAFDAIITKHGLEKIKTIGDAYMAVCGLPQADPRHAQRCLRAALEIRDFIAARLATAQSGSTMPSGPGAFQIRIGIHSGPVVAGIVGVKKFAYDIWGDTVNMAARMEQHGEAGKVNISAATYDLVKDDYACRYRGKLNAKNKGEVDMYFAELKHA